MNLLFNPPSLSIHDYTTYVCLYASSNNYCNITDDLFCSYYSIVCSLLIMWYLDELFVPQQSYYMYIYRLSIVFP